MKKTKTENKVPRGLYETCMRGAFCGLNRVIKNAESPGKEYLEEIRHWLVESMGDFVFGEVMSSYSVKALPPKQRSSAVGGNVFHKCSSPHKCGEILSCDKYPCAGHECLAVCTQCKRMEAIPAGSQ